jgi:uncharacterized membrane protein
MMETLVLPNMSLSAVLVGYLATQFMMAAFIYWMLSTASRREIQRMFGDAGKEFFIKGFDVAAREALSSIIKETSDQAIVTSELAIATAKELAIKTAREADIVAERFTQIDRQLCDLKDTFDKIDQMRGDMHETNVSVAELHIRLTDFFERYNANKS